jgi:hypothetical protein
MLDGKKHENGFSTIFIGENNSWRQSPGTVLEPTVAYSLGIATAQVVKCLPTKTETLNSNTSTQKIFWLKTEGIDFLLIRDWRNDYEDTEIQT